MGMKRDFESITAVGDRQEENFSPVLKKQRRSLVVKARRVMNGSGKKSMKLCFEIRDGSSFDGDAPQLAASQDTPVTEETLSLVSASGLRWATLSSKEKEKIVRRNTRINTLPDSARIGLKTVTPSTKKKSTKSCRFSDNIAEERLFLKNDMPLMASRDAVVFQAAPRSPCSVESMLEGLDFEMPSSDVLECY